MFTNTFKNYLIFFMTHQQYPRCGQFIFGKRKQTIRGRICDVCYLVGGFIFAILKDTRQWTCSNALAGSWHSQDIKKDVSLLPGLKIWGRKSCFPDGYCAIADFYGLKYELLSHSQAYFPNLVPSDYDLLANRRKDDSGKNVEVKWWNHCKVWSLFWGRFVKRIENKASKCWRNVELIV